MEWTVEKVRELPPDNLFGVKRVGPHTWQIGDKDMVLWTGDGGVIEYLNSFEQIVGEYTSTIEPDFTTFNEGSATQKYTIKLSDLEEIIRNTLFKNGMA